jgi:NADPH-dependent stearoyl-CoA 9-desaturase
MKTMAITDVDVFAHLTDADIENLAVELDAIRQDVEDSRGARDSRYIRRTIAGQRALEVIGRLLLAASSRRSAWWAGTVTLGVAKIVENMEIGHNVMHGQWDWMNDPEIHSSTWEWDMSGSSKHWRYSHNFVHHKYTNILGMDDDVGYGLLRVTRDQRWARSRSAGWIRTKPGTGQKSSWPRPAVRYSRTMSRSRRLPRCRLERPTHPR